MLRQVRVHDADLLVFDFVDSLFILVRVELAQWVVALLLHYPVKVFEVNQSFLVRRSVCLANHFFDLFIREVLANLSGYFTKVLKADFASLVFIEQLEDLEDFLLGVSLGHYGGYYAEELFESQALAYVLRNFFEVADHVDLLDRKAERPHCGLKLSGIDGA